MRNDSADKMHRSLTLSISPAGLIGRDCYLWLVLVHIVNMGQHQPKIANNYPFLTPFNPSACLCFLVLHAESPLWWLFLVEIIFIADKPKPGSFEHLQFFHC